MRLLIPNQFVINSHPITKTLIHWYSGAKRDLPWRKTKEPYIVWVSEIILQQTRVDQGLPYFERFIESFPDIETLADAKDDDVLANWQGLGYYSRARNLHFTAKHIVGNLDGKFPNTYKELIKLKGIGPYTAAAISSICYDEPEPVVDGNVFRVASRIFGIEDDISLSATRQIFVKVLRGIIPHNQPGEFNQAVMEYGATVCKPQPNCDICVLRELCYANKEGLISRLPFKSKKTKVRNRQINYLVIERKGELLMKKRKQKDIWEGMYDFPEVEALDIKIDSKSPLVSGPVTHVLSHQKLSVQFLQFGDVTSEQFSEFARSNGCEAFSIKQILTLPKPKIIVDYMSTISSD